MEQLGQRTGKILVVDDEKNYRIVLARLFEGAGYQVLVAHDAESAMEILQRERVSLIISDLCLAALDGSDRQTTSGGCLLPGEAVRQSGDSQTGCREPLYR